MCFSASLIQKCYSNGESGVSLLTFNYEQEWSLLEPNQLPQAHPTIEQAGLTSVRAESLQALIGSNQVGHQ